MEALTSTAVRLAGAAGECYSQRRNIMTKPTGRITILTPCLNERENVRALHEQIRDVTTQLPDLSFEHLFIDNASTDGTQDELRKLASENPSVKIILNQRNFGHRSEERRVG